MLMRSRPGTPPLSLMAMVGLGLWLAPVALGGGCLALFGMIGGGGGTAGIAFWAAGMALLLSPLFSWAGWVIALPAAWALMAQGWFGWLPAAALGLAAGAMAGALMDSTLGTPFGVAAMLALRAVLGRLWPQGFGR